MSLFGTARRRVKDSGLFLFLRARRSRAACRDWVRAGRPFPPPHAVKEAAVREYARRFRLPVLVETGTYRGEMIAAVKDLFEEVYSIELSTELWRRARERFAHARRVSILQGDSGQVMRELLPRIRRPCLFWLDGHYSAGMTAKGDLETPIRAELDQIFGHPLAREHVILIDDARCFTGEGDYPTLGFVRELAAKAGLDRFEVEEDIIRIHRGS